MDPIKIRSKKGPEFKIQDLFVKYLAHRQWFVERLIGNELQKGIPDLYLFHRKHGPRWVDIKVHGQYSFTPAQKDKWPKWEAAGIGIWILGATSPETCTKLHMAAEHNLLLQPPNWRNFWKSSWDKPDIDAMIDELSNETNQK